MSKAPKGCKYLQELRFNPQQSCNNDGGGHRNNGTISNNTVGAGKINTVMPRVVAYTLRNLKCLRICDIDTLAEGLQFYLHGPEGGYHPKLNRLDRLKLTYFEGRSDKLTHDLLQVGKNAPTNSKKNLYYLNCVTICV